MSKRLSSESCFDHQIPTESSAKKLRLIPDHHVDWNVEDVHNFFVQKGFMETAKILEKEKINGKDLGMLTEERLQKIGIGLMGQRLEFMREIENLQNTSALPSSQNSFGSPNAYFGDSNTNESKIFNDPIHGHIDMPPLCLKLIDTPQFQRLRHIKQLGGCYMVFPGASNNRFEHCIGVCHLAGELVRAIKGRQPELGITDKDILCVQIAGLCHDLGHGPFSHMFDGMFIPSARPGYKWQHEQASVSMFEYLVEDNDMVQHFERYGLTETDQTFIKEQIAGPLYRDKNNVQKWQYQGRDESKSFLYEIVANKRNGVDVDKWDYFARDCHHLGISSNFDHSRFMKFSRVIKEGGQMQICNRDKEVGNIYDMFYTRSVLHRRAYQHKTSNIIEIMICEALLMADDHIKILGTDGKPCKISECIDDMVAYTKLNDTIYHRILHSEKPELKDARAILQNIERRQLYKCVGQTKPINPDSLAIHKAAIPQMRQEITTAMVDDMDMSVLRPDDIIVSVVNIDYGNKHNNPIDNVRFYSKSNPNAAISIRKEQVSHMLPERFSDQYIRVYSRKSDKDSLNNLHACFQQWCKNRDMVEPKGGDIYSLEMTPLKPSPVKYPSLPNMRTMVPTKLNL